MRRAEHRKKLILTQNEIIQLNTEKYLSVYLLKPKILNATVCKVHSILMDITSLSLNSLILNMYSDRSAAKDSPVLYIVVNYKSVVFKIFVLNSSSLDYCIVMKTIHFCTEYLPYITSRYTVFRVTREKWLVFHNTIENMYLLPDLQMFNLELGHFKGPIP